MPQVPSSAEQQRKVTADVVKACPNCVSLSIFVFAGQWTCGRCGHDFTEPAYWKRCVGPADTAIADWQPIEGADVDTEYLLFSPARRLSDHPDQRDDFRVASPRNWTWATHFQPLPKGPTR